MRQILLIGTGLLAIASVCFPTSTADAMVGDYLSYFNIPKVDVVTHKVIPSRTIQNKLLAYIDGATYGSEIRGHITTLSKFNIATALIRANLRGVAVYLVHNGSEIKDPTEEWTPGKLLEQHFGTRHKYCWEDRGSTGPSEEDLTSCVSSIDGEIGDRPTHHIKNWMFSNTVVGGIRRTYSSWVASYNLTETSDKQYNDVFIVNDNYALYSAYVESFKSFYGQRRSDDFYNVAGRGHHIIPSANVEIAYAPHTTSPRHTDYYRTNDDVAMALSRIAYEPGCALKVVMLSISNSRSAIIDELLRIGDDGCLVQIAYSSMNLSAWRRLIAGQVDMRCKRWPDWTSEPGEPAIHSKMMLYKGKYDGMSGRTFVWGGSHNWTMGSARLRDEVFVGISRLGIYKNYSNYFDAVWKAWTRPDYECVD